MPIVSKPLLISLLLLLSGCTSVAGSTPANDAQQPTTLAPCLALPNCVSSSTGNSGQAIAPLSLGADGDATWARLRVLLETSSEFTIVKATETYLHAEARTRVFRFVDDVEFLLQEEGIAVRSASRVGFSDFGTNRRRVESLRRQLATESAPAAN